MQDAIERFQKLVQFRTVSGRIDEEEIRAEFDKLFDHIDGSYPTIKQRARMELDRPWRIVIEIEGTKPDLHPLLLLAHFDVVDVEAGTESDWAHPPFGGEESDGKIWGRGTLDDKCCLSGLLDATELLLSKKGMPERPVILAFGGDEELSGLQGAGQISERFRLEARRFHAVLDEGAIVADGMLKNPSKPIALIGVAEKGFANIAIEADGSGGHAAMPPKSTALGHVARAISVVERKRFRPRLLPSVDAFFRELGRHAAFPTGFIFSHAKVLWPLLSRVLAGKPTTDALIRTTQAVTMASGSAAPGVLPQRARAVINNRILPGQTVEDVLSHYQRLLSRHPVTVSIAPEGGANDPVLRSRQDHSAYQSLTALIRSHFPEAIPAPFLVTASTDSKWYADLADGTYRFVPIKLSNEELSGIHGTNEHISLDSYKKMVYFYSEFIERECYHAE
jgi:carboxypeptidase PM20D1